jgi:hypothetical protein
LDTSIETSLCDLETPGAPESYLIFCQETTMRGYRSFALVMTGLLLAGCTSDPDAAVNQTTPIRQMDNFFNSFSAGSRPSDYSQRPSDYSRLPPDYTHEPGYAPAYPAY